MPTELQTKQGELNAKREQWIKLYESDTPDAAELKRLNDEMEPLGEEVETLTKIEAAGQKHRQALESSREIKRDVSFASGSSDLPDVKPEQKSLGDTFIESDAYKGFNPSNGCGPMALIEGYEIKTTFNEVSGFAPQSIRTGQIIESAQQMPRVVDLIPSVTTDYPSVVFMQETTFTNAAAEVSEAAAYPEAALAYTETTSPVRKIAVFIPTTDEAMADVPSLRDRLNNRLTLMLRQRLDQEIITGDGIAPDLTGILNTSGILTQALAGSDANADAIYKAIVKLQATGFVEPNGIIMHPNNWQTVRLLKTSTGEYIFGSPFDPGIQRLWGLPVVTTTYMTANSAVVADFANFTELAFRRGIEFEVTNSHSTYFVNGLLAIRAQLRVAFVVLRATAICKVTSLN